MPETGLSHRQILSRVYEAFNKGNLDDLRDYVADDLIIHDPMPGSPPGLEGMKAALEITRAAIPDFEIVAQATIVEGEFIVSRAQWSGTHTGESFMGVPATGRRITCRGVDILRIQDGKVTEAWECGDHLGVMQQLGVAPGVGYTDA